MHPKTAAILLMALGLVIMISNWSLITDRLLYEEGATRSEEITIWSTSGDPQRTRLIASEFMDAHPETNIVLHFRESGSIGEVIFVSFLSGNPPDLMDISLNQVREYIADGMLRPIDDQLEAELARNPDFLSDRLGGELEVFRWFTNPNDPYIREMDRYPEQAARLINMHNRVIGFTNMNFPPMMTYNRKVFQDAARVFPEAGLVDESGEPIPPATWSELIRVARVITDYGKTLGSEENRPYGLVVQGQRPRDIMRGLEPLAAVAGSRGFDFAGSPWVEGMTEPVGRYTYEDPAFLGALSLLLILKEEGSIVPGTSGRHFEEPRTMIGEGRAAMLIEDWHAALRAAITVPIHQRDIGSAPVPRPDEAFEERVGLPLGRGAVPAEMGQGLTAMTSGTRHPEAVWNWMHFPLSLERQEHAVGQNLSLPRSWQGAEELFFNPDRQQWREEHLIPYQKMAWRNFTEAAVWPIPPVHGPVRQNHYQAVLHSAFHDYQGTGEEDRRELVEETRRQLEAYSRAVNEDLARRIRSGEHDPASFTFGDWDPTAPADFFLRQRSETVAVPAEEMDLLRAQLPEEYRDLVYGFRNTPGWTHLASILGLIFLTVVGYLVYRLQLDYRQGRKLLAGTRKGMRECWYAYIFVFPAIFSLFAFVLYPSLYQFYLAFHSGTGMGVLQFVGGEQFGALLQDRKFWGEVVPNTFLYMAIVAAGEVSIGLFLALLLVLPFRANGVYRILFFIPLVTSLAAVSIIFFGLVAGQDSTINQILFQFSQMVESLTGRNFYHPGNAIDWLNDERFSLYTVMGVAIWSGVPFNTILCMAGLQSISPDLYEAARVDGAKAHQRFIHITIPQMLPILIIVIFNSLIGAARHFGTVYIMTEGERGTEIASTYIFKWGFVRTAEQVPDIGYASALGLAYALLLGVFVIFNIWFIANRWKKRLTNTPAEPSPSTDA